jgi:type I restriction enzyme S subunit
MKNFKKYPSYKDSEIEWLNCVPKHWDEIKVKHIFKERVEKGFPGKPLLAATQSNGVIKKEDYETNTVTAQKDFHLLKLVKPGDFVISLRSFQGGIEISHEEGIISPAYTIMKPSKAINKNYFKHLYKSKYFIDGLTTFVTGIREGQNIDYSKFRRSHIISPPLPEQTAIANFLDKKTTEIKEFISLKEKTIELLKERAFKLAINGFEKPKEVYEWEDNFPSYWKVLKGKWLFNEVKIRNRPNEDLLAVTQNRGVLPKSMCDENFVTPDDKGLISQKFVLKESFIISLRSFQGGIEFSYYQGIVSPAYTVFVLKEEFDNEALRIFYKYFFKSKPFIELLNTIISGIRDGQNISFTDFSRLSIPIPDKATIDAIFELDNLILKEEIQTINEIELIKEYQQSLISEVVTGKVDVRGFIAKAS